METIHEVFRKARDSRWIARRFQPKWSGILVVDGKVVRVFDPLAHRLDHTRMTPAFVKALHKRTWLCSIDYGTGDLPHYELAEGETMVDMVLFFQTLKDEIHYDLQVLVCDGNDDIVRAARKIYGKSFLVQRCTRHYLEGLKMNLIRQGAGDDPRMSELLEIIKAVIQTRTMDASWKALQSLRRKRFTHPLHGQALRRLESDVETLTTYLQYPFRGIPRTSNDIENLFRQVQQRLDTVCRFGHQEYARDYLKTWALMRRTTPYTDCRGWRKCRNGKAPLELAGCQIDGIDYLEL